jgi:hypothetical protein
VGPGGRRFTPDLSVPGYPELFVVGDTAAVMDQRGIPGTAPTAKQMGRYVGTAHRSVDRGSRARRHHFRYRHQRLNREAIMSKTITKEDRALLEKVSEMFDETGCVPGIDGVEVPAERIVPDAKQYISEAIDNPEVLYDPEIWDTPGFTLVLSWLAQKWHRRCHRLTLRGRKNPEQYLTKEQQKACLDSAAAELIREITQQRLLN